MNLILTCEHAGNELPAEYAFYFQAAGEVLETHRGYDPGALDLFSELEELAIWNKCSMTTRLLIELNRSVHHPDLFSEFSGGMDAGEKTRLLTGSYLPYRSAVQQKVSELMEKGGKVFHLSVHTFTPQLNGAVRNADIGILYDPSRAEEKSLAATLKAAILKEDHGLKVRFNYPYLGKADGFTTSLRSLFRENYLGIELEVNQKFVTGNKMDLKVKKIIYNSIKHLLDANN